MAPAPFYSSVPNNGLNTNVIETKNTSIMTETPPIKATKSNVVTNQHAKLSTGGQMEFTTDKDNVLNAKTSAFVLSPIEHGHTFDEK